MFFYYLKFAFRNLKRHKAFSIINVLGLSIGLTGCLLACLFIQDELKYDKHFTNTNSVFRLVGNNSDGANISYSQPAAFLPLILEKYPEIESGNCIFKLVLNIGCNQKHFIENNFIFSDSNFFKFYGWKLLIGNPENVLNAPSKVVISAKKAKELFGNEDPVGKILTLELSQVLTVTGVFKDIPSQSQIKADFIASKSTLKTFSPEVLTSWGNFGSSLNLKLYPSTNLPDLMQKISQLWNNNPLNDCCGEKGPNVHLKLQQFSKVYFQTITLNGEKFGNTIYIIGFSVIAGILLIIALFNYINLSIAQIANRFLEAGVKKVVGASFTNLYKQLLVETSMYVFIAIFLSNFFLETVLPGFNSFTGKNIEFALFTNPVFIIFNIAIFLFTIISTSLYPAFYFARIQPLAAINSGKYSLSSKFGKRSYFWDIMVTTQFALAIFLIVSAFMVNKQLYFIRNTDSGFVRENVISIENGWNSSLEKRYQLYKEKILKLSEITMVSSGLNVPPDRIWNFGAPKVVNSSSPELIDNCGLVSVDYDYFKVLGSKIIEGRDFDKTLNTDENKCIISEGFSRKMGEKNPIGIILDQLNEGKRREIIGVVNDINFKTVHDEITPEVFILHHNSLPSHYNILVKFKTANTTALLIKLEKIWIEMAPDEPFTYFFLDEKFESNYRKEIQVAKILNILTGVAIFLCCLGLFGLALFVVNNRTKEIGIRKINGASVFKILYLVNRPFIQWITIAFIVACPVALWVVQGWLQDFAYKTKISWWIFALAGLLSLWIALVTASFHSIRAANRNPVDALRYE
jgi:putative ABC transport system permease protein